jgi:hypothetical protein
LPRIPIVRPPEDAGGQGTGDGPGTLPPDEAAGLRTLEARTARIDRELAVSQSWLAGLTRLAEAEDAPEGPSPGFTRSFLEETDRERSLVLKPLPLDRQASVAQDLMALRQGFAERAAAVEADGMALRRRLALHRTLEGYRTGMAQDPGVYDDAAGRMQALVSDLGLPEERKHALDLHIRDALGNAAVDGLMQEPERAERLLSTGLFDDALTEASKASRLTEAQGLVARNRLLARERTLSELMARARGGTASEEAIAAAEQGGSLTAAESDHLRARNREAGQATELRQARIQRVALAATLDPSDPEDKAAADAYWEEVSEVYASDNAEAQRKAELAFVERIGVLPDALRRKYQGALLSADPTIAVSGARAIDGLTRLSSALVTDVPADQRQRSGVIAKYAFLDIPPERAIELAGREITDSTTKPEPTEHVGTAAMDSTSSESDKIEVGATLNSVEILAALPDAVSDVLAEEGSTNDTEIAAGLTEITTTALALGLPLSDETAEMFARLANGERAVGTEATLLPILLRASTVAIKALKDGGKIIGRLWRRLTNSRRREDEKGEEPQQPRLPFEGAPSSSPGQERNDGSSPREEAPPAQTPSDEENASDADDATVSGNGDHSAGRGEVGGSLSDAEPRSLENVEVRKWYHERLQEIPSRIDSNLTLKEQALEAYQLPNEIRRNAQRLMKDEELAKSLPTPKTFEQLIREAEQDGLKGDEIWRRIIESAGRSNQQVDRALGILREDQ